jgi:hypothetical protein
MINIQELEQTEEFKSILPKKGYYKKRVPEIIKLFGEQHFARCHVEAVLAQDLGPVRYDDEIKNRSSNARHWIYELEALGCIEKTGENTLGRQVLYRNVL